MKKILKCLLMTILLISVSGCIKRDNLDEAKILTGNFPLEYIIKRLYGNNSTIVNLYPDGTNPDEIKFNKKQINDFAKNNLYIYNGQNKRQTDMAIKLKKINPHLLLIDATMGINNSQDLEEVWLNPSNMLMLSLNIKQGMDEYLKSSFLQRKIDKEYEKLKLDLSNLDASLRLLSTNAKKRTIIVGNNGLTFLNKYGFNIISLDTDEAQKDKALNEARNAIDNEYIKHVYVIQYKDNNSALNDLINNHSLEKITIMSLVTISDNDRKLKKDYLMLMRDNIDLIKKGTY